MTTTTNPLPDLPFPAGASFVDEWEEPNTPGAWRYWSAPRTLIPVKRSDVSVWVSGMQHADGSVTPEVCVSQLHHDEPLTAAEARQIARAMMNAADAAERIGEQQA